jgi:hypothetical protein
MRHKKKGSPIGIKGGKLDAYVANAGEQVWAEREKETGMGHS